MKIKIAVANSRMEKFWRNRDLSWDELTYRLSSTYRTGETVQEYRNMPKAQQDAVKDIGGFVGGALKDGRRKKGHVESRSILTLDADYASSDFWSCVKDKFTCCIYSTHKHTEEKPRLRLVVLLKRAVSEEEYPAVARMVAKDIGLEMFDDTTYEPSRLMYWPSTSSDGEFVFEKSDAGVLDPDKILAMYKDWRDSSQWPVSDRQRKLIKSTLDKQADPLEKPGIVGAFCRTYSIEDVIEKFLEDVYEPCGYFPGRYSYIPADSTAGVLVYDGKFAYSHHASDPACGKLCNSFDLVRIHRFGELDEKASEDTPIGKLPSFIAMQEFASKDAEVKKLLAEERTKEAKDEFDEENWQDALELNKKGTVVDSLTNLILILSHDPMLKNIVFNQHIDGMEITGEVPWKHPERWWRDADDAQLISYIDRTYGLFSKGKYNIAVTKVSDDRSYHPIKDFLNGLPEWDGVPRADTLLIEYFDAEDNEYVREVTRKTLCAAVARVFEPGIKFDYMLVLNGKQGIGKSTLFRKLGSPWFCDSLQLSDTHDKTAAEKLQGYWILEVSEMAGMKKTDIETLKAFITRQEDVYRATFGKRAVPHPRQCIFVGTTNSDRGFLRDITGNRRFWPVKVQMGKKDPRDITLEEVRQVWAEVMVRYRANELLCLKGEAERYAEEMQREAMETDEREGVIEAYLDKLLPENWQNWDMYRRKEYIREYDEKDSVLPKGKTERKTASVLEIWCEAFGNVPGTLKRTDSYEIFGIMRKLKGWEYKGRIVTCGPYGRQKVFERAQPEAKSIKP
ncbi:MULTISPECIES: virulence-associated E family protein [Oscillospiraceae]|uniref:Virulence-associated E family protein n=1 Tax=Pseudobacteroides cellulosolvens ATCC 35603 = DSM 2933 TaxID=398512 RepID=A0A0L6JUF9_9FIRM|nr:MULTISPECIES: virulence-associated E family protein [Oscillospiraceae]KNY29062.1 virulence-associated E family protein [Pseudobacteroides cellulosolvens ATCC 35603 = DSM 2933]